MLFRNKEKKHFAQQILINSQSSILLGLYDMKSKWFREKEKTNCYSKRDPLI